MKSTLWQTKYKGNLISENMPICNQLNLFNI